VQILAGLNDGEQVVTSAQFMLDSESKLREAIQKMIAPKAPADADLDHEEHEDKSGKDLEDLFN
jgi:Cu(I)/Ag(I) efflux system membrane fusion protein/cobalt-zinc-cadmium efflux system membrane fusion protein